MDINENKNTPICFPKNKPHKIPNGTGESRELREIPFKTIFTGQHQELYDDVKKMVPEFDYYLDIMKDNQSLNEIISGISTGFNEILKKESPNLFMVQGDTSSATISAIIAFYKKIPVGHVEAGLRTYNKYSPFPEEMNRCLISKIADIHLCPTTIAVNNLRKEGITQKVYLVGNTVVDAFNLISNVPNS